MTNTPPPRPAARQTHFQASLEGDIELILDNSVLPKRPSQPPQSPLVDLTSTLPQEFRAMIDRPANPGKPKELPKKKPPPSRVLPPSFSQVAFGKASHNADLIKIAKLRKWAAKATRDRQPTHSPESSESEVFVPPKKRTREESERQPVQTTQELIKEMDERHAKAMEEQAQNKKKLLAVDNRQRQAEIEQRRQAQREAYEAGLSPEERRHFAQQQRYSNRFDISDFYLTVFNLNLWDLRKAEDSLKQIPNVFEDGEDYATALKPCFFSELRGDLDKAGVETDLERASSVQLSVFSEKSPFLFLVPGANENSGRPIFQLTFKQDDLVLCVPAQTPLPRRLKDLSTSCTSFLGVCEHEIKNDQKQALMLIRVLRTEKTFQILGVGGFFYVIYVETLVTMIREYRMIQLAEFLDLSSYILNPHLKPPGGPLNISKSFFSLIKTLFNESQFNAIVYACSKSSGFTLIQGPPGTGKTHTILGLISAFLASESPLKPKILVCAPSNAAIDEIASRVVRKGVLDGNGQSRTDISMVRIGNWRQDHVEIKQKNPQNQREPPIEVQAIALSSLLSKRMQEEGIKDQPELISELRSQLNQVERAIIAANGKKDGKTVTELTGKQQTLNGAITREKYVKYSNEEKRRAYEAEIVQSADVIFATLSGAGSKDMEKAKHSFDFVIIDEACQAVELSCLIPLQYGARHVVLVGDPRQLPATTFSHTAEKAGYSRSLFEVSPNQRMEQAGCGTFLLRIQYRMVADIRAFPSGYFYNNFLQDHESISERKTPIWLPAFPVLFVNLKSSYESRTSDDTSVSNRNEADFVIDLFEEFRRFHGSQMDIGIISPYKKQVRLLRNLLHSRFGPDLKRDIEVNTVDGFQGREKEMIIFSCVRSGEHIGFLSDVRRLNVAITRARSCLVLVGCENTLIRNDCWREMIVYLKSRDATVSCDRFSDVRKMFEKEEIREERQLVTVENPGRWMKNRGQVDRGALMRLIGEVEGNEQENKR